MTKKVRYPCKCGKSHELVIHWYDGITYLSCGKRIENKILLNYEVMCVECGCELWHEDPDNKSDYCDDCLKADEQYWEDKRDGLYEDF